MKWVDRIVGGQAARGERDRAELAFLPAALEIVETPPSPIGRSVAYSIMAIFCLAIIWACLGHVDIVASASGKIIPSGRTKVIQPLEIGVVKAIHVREGQGVKEGEPLIELESTAIEAERNHVQSDLVAAQLDIARLRAAFKDGEDPVKDLKIPEGAPQTLILSQTQLLTSQVGEFRAKLATFARQKIQKESELATTVATINKINEIIPTIQARVDVRTSLGDFSSKLSYYETLQQLTEYQQEVLVQKSRQKEAEAAIEAIAENVNQARAEYFRNTLKELVAAEQKVDGLRQDLIKAEQRIRQAKLTAPIDGTVQQLAVHTVGGVVTPAQVLLMVVPTESRLEVDAVVLNRDVGFVRAEQPAAIKVDAFNFTRYGLVSGKVVNISQDAVLQSKTPEGQANNPGAQTAGSDLRGQELVYVARVSLDESSIQVDGKSVKLLPGMAVTVDIKTGSRTIISYLLSPLLKSQQESLRER